MVQDLMDQLTQKEQTTSLNFEKMANQALKDVWEHGREDSYKDLQQQFLGQQARIDHMNMNTVQTERQASADHSMIQQLRQAYSLTINSVEKNTQLMNRLIRQLQLPIDVSGKDVLKILKAESGTTIHQLVTEAAVKKIQLSQDNVNYVASTVQNNENIVLRAQQGMNDDLKSFRIFLLWILSGTILAMVSPWMWLKLVFGAAGIIGGVLYDRIKS